MKSKLVFLATIALMTGGMAIAQNSADSQGRTSTAPSTQMGGLSGARGYLPGVKYGESQHGRNSMAKLEDIRPGSAGTAVTPDQGISPKGVRPATGMDNHLKGTTDTNGSRPGVEAASAQS
jgi:hypothetical protein